MAKQTINIGTTPNSRNGDPLREAFTKVNENFSELYTAVSAIGGEPGTGGAVSVNIKGSVLSQDSTILLDSVTGKLNISAIPSGVPKIFKFVATFLSDGNLDAIDSLPSGWTASIVGNTVTINHTVGSQPSIITYWGYVLDTGEHKFRYPTAGYQAIMLPGADYPFSLTLNTAVTGADNGQYAIVTILF